MESFVGSIVFNVNSKCECAHSLRIAWQSENEENGTKTVAKLVAIVAKKKICPIQILINNKIILLHRLPKKKQKESGLHFGYSLFTLTVHTKNEMYKRKFM